MQYKFSNLWEYFIRFYKSKNPKSKVLDQLYVAHISGDVKGFIRLIFQKFTYVIYQLDYDKNYIDSVLSLGKTDKATLFRQISKTIKAQAKFEA